MAIISLTCQHCGGNIILDDSNEIGTCENCFSQFKVKEDKIVQQIEQHITKYVFGYEGKDVEELLVDADKLLELGDIKGANRKFNRAIEIEPDCWNAWLGYASTGGDRKNYVSVTSAYIKAFNVAKNEQQESKTYVSMLEYIPEQKLRSVFMRAFNSTSRNGRGRIFELVSGVIGCEESEMTRLAVDLCPNDWRAYYVMGKFRIIRVKWCKLEGNIFTGKHLPSYAEEVLDIFMKAYYLAEEEGEKARVEMVKYFEELEKQGPYNIFIVELKKKLKI